MKMPTINSSYHKMKVIFYVLASLALAQARPQNFNPNAIVQAAQAVITKYDYQNLGNGLYSFIFESSDGTRREETAELINEGKENEAIAVRGSYSYLGPDGQTYNVNYTADDEGFQPEGEHLPPSAGVKKPQLQIPSAALASLAGGGLG